MPHTLELSMKLSDWQHSELIVKKLYDYAVRYNNNCCCPLEEWTKGEMTATGVVFKGFTQKGITMYVIEYKSPLFHNYIWEIKINPKSLYGIDRISVANEDDVRKCFGVLDSLLQNNLYISYSHKDFKIKRIDCCYNYYFKNDDIAKLYMSLLKKGDISNRFNVYQTYSQKAHRKVVPKDSIYCWNKSVTINIYIKTLQLKNDRYIDDNYDFAPSTGLIRMEVQCNRNKLVSSKNRMQVDDLYPEAFIKDDFNFYILRNYLIRLFKIGDYYTFSYAKSVIENSAFQNKSKSLIITLLELTSHTV